MCKEYMETPSIHRGLSLNPIHHPPLHHLLPVPPYSSPSNSPRSDIQNSSLSPTERLGRNAAAPRPILLDEEAGYDEVIAERIVEFFGSGQRGAEVEKLGEGKVGGVGE